VISDKASTIDIAIAVEGRLARTGNQLTHEDPLRLDAYIVVDSRSNWGPGKRKQNLVYLGDEISDLVFYGRSYQSPCKP